jgi:hypothetical protein
MPLYLVSYDLLNKKTFGDYETLITELRRLKAGEVLYSQWLLRTSSTSIQVRDHLRRFMHADDRIFVTEINLNWAGWNTMIDPTKS